MKSKTIISSGHGSCRVTTLNSLPIYYAAALISIESFIMQRYKQSIIFILFEGTLYDKTSFFLLCMFGKIRTNLWKKIFF